MYLGIDLGTSSVKVVLIDEEQKIIAQNSQALMINHPKPLWSEQNPHDWWQATDRAVKILKNNYAKELTAVKAIGLAGQQHGATLLDKNNQILRPAILWNDGRSMAQCQQLEQEVSDYAEITGNRIMPGFTAPKVLWVAQHEIEIFNQVNKILLPKDYLRLKITGDYASDLSDAAGTSWLNVKKRAWSDKMLNATGLKQSHMPALFEGSAITGKILPTIAQEWGLSPNVVVVGGGGDNAAGAISVNVIKSGQAFLSLGTSGVYFVASNTYQANPARAVHTFCHCLPGLWHQMSVHLSAANCISWLANILQVNNTHNLLIEAEQTSASHDSIIFLPYLSGERTPHNNPYARGIFFGLSNTTQRTDLVNAVLEGVAFAFADGQDAMLAAGTVINEVSVVGGGAQSFYWGKILAAALKRPLIYRANREVGAAFGAARLAWLASNNTDPLTFATPAVEKIIEPDDKLAANYEEKRVKFKKLYENVKDIFTIVIPREGAGSSI